MENALAIILPLLTFISTIFTAVLNCKLKKREQQKELFVHRNKQLHKALVDEYNAKRKSYAKALTLYFRDNYSDAVRIFSGQNIQEEDRETHRLINQMRENLNDLWNRIIENNLHRDRLWRNLTD